MFEAKPRELPHLRELLAPILSGNPLVVAGLAGGLPGLAVVDSLTAPTSCLAHINGQQGVDGIGTEAGLPGRAHVSGVSLSWPVADRDNSVEEDTEAT